MGSARGRYHLAREQGLPMCFYGRRILYLSPGEQVDPDLWGWGMGNEVEGQCSFEWKNEQNQAYAS